MRGRIKAGEAYVGLGVRNNLKAGLNKASAQLKKFGAGLGRLGAPVLAAGGAISGAFLGASKVFASAGDELNKMSARTGVGVETLSRLGFAADRSGASLADVEKSTRGMARTLLNANDGLTTAVDSLAELGLTAEDLNGKSPEDQFLLMADALSKIQDPTKKAAVAMRVFGKSGTALIPMLEGGAEGMKKLFGESDRLGQTLSTDQANAAAKLTDAFGDLGGGLKGIVIQIGAAVAGPMISMVNALANVTASAISWIKENQSLVAGIAGVGVALLAAGSAIVGFGLAATAASVAVAGIASVASVVLSPIGLIVGGITAATVAFFTFTETGRNVVDWFVGNFKKVFDSVTSVVGSISDALQAGDMALAAEIGFTAVKLAIGTILDEIESLFGVSFESMFKVVAQLGKSIAQVVGKLNQARQGAVNFLSEGLGSLFLSAEAQKVLSEDNKRASERAAKFTESINNFDADKFGSDINDAFDVDALSAKLEELKKQAKKAREAVQSPEGPQAADPFSVELGAAKLQQAAKASFSNFVGLSARSSQRSGPGARKIEDKILAENQKQTDLLKEIRDKKGGLKFS